MRVPRIGKGWDAMHASASYGGDVLVETTERSACKAVCTATAEKGKLER